MTVAPPRWPVLHLAKLPTPARLDKVTRNLNERTKTRTGTQRDKVAEAKRWLSETLAAQSAFHLGASTERAEAPAVSTAGGDRGGRPLPKSLLSAMLHVAAELSPGATRDHALHLVLSAPQLGWRHHMLAWRIAGAESPLPTHTSIDRASLATSLARRLWRLSAQSRRFRERSLPTWLAGATHEDALIETLRDAAQTLAKQSNHRQTPLHHLPRAWDLSDALYPVPQAMEHLLKHGSIAWWEKSSEAQVCDWAETQSITLRNLAVDRLLRTWSKQPKEKEKSRNLLSWILRVMGDPEKRPGKWSNISTESRDEFEKLLLDHELERIFEEFAKRANDDRARFWRRKVHQVDDALFFQAAECAVCILKFGSMLAIEFGDTGNACYFYRVNSIPRLRNFDFKHGTSVRFFKQKQGFRIKGSQLDFERKLNHVTGWMTSFDAFMTFEHPDHKIMKHHDLI